MTNIILKDETTEAGSRLILAMCGKKNVEIFIDGPSQSYVNVCVKNASHKAWGMPIGGKHFSSVSDAIFAYKSPDIKALLASLKNN